MTATPDDTAPTLDEHSPTLLGHGLALQRQLNRLQELVSTLALVDAAVAGGFHDGAFIRGTLAAAVAHDELPALARPSSAPT